jgi:hypothetical protein
MRAVDVDFATNVHTGTCFAMNGPPTIGSVDVNIRARIWKQIVCTFGISVLVTGIAVEYRAAAQGSSTTLGAPFQRRVLAAALPESPFDLRFFSTAVKTDNSGKVITNVDAPGPGKLVGAEAVGDRAGLPRFAKILFTANYFTGTARDRLDPNNQIAKSGSEHWPFVKQPFRSWPNAIAVTPDGTKLYVTLPGRDGYPD